MPTTTSASTAAAAQRRRSRRKAPPPRQPWCCSFGLDPSTAAATAAGRSPGPLPAPPRAKPPPHQLPPPLSRRIRSPGRVSPIDDPTLPGAAGSSSVSARLSSVTECPPPALLAPPPPPAAAVEKPRAILKLRLVDKGVILEVDELERVRRESKVVGKILGERGGELTVEGMVEVDAFREVVDMMLEDEDEAAAMRRLARGGVARAIDVLEVSLSLMFDRGVNNCLRYLDAVPWNEFEEETIKKLMYQHSSYKAAFIDLLARLQPERSASSAELVVELADSITKGTNNNARKELRNLVNGILSKSSVYIKGDKELDSRSIYCICHSCLNSLVGLFEESSELAHADQTSLSSVGKGPLSRIYKLVEDINWLLQILIDRQMGEEFVDVWANQKTLSSMHERCVTDGTPRAQPDFGHGVHRHGERQAPLHRRQKVRRLPGLVQANAGRFRLAPEIPEGPQHDGPRGRNRASAADAHIEAAAGAVLGVVRGVQRPRSGMPRPDQSLPGVVAAVVREILR
ncbi:unnamed protein product [Miscanthus lutarioriparius]|uniref:At3g05675-like ankyrin-like domain-containing protein n=1 Tax=Miscanthus lutarioriparius TaxID=422564 RepID=A0A811RKN0_9POAL|nr:unnamed protein product [Miscanthus lutarioriparius]